MANMCYEVYNRVEPEMLDGAFLKSVTRDLREGKARKRVSLENLRCWISGI